MDLKEIRKHETDFKWWKEQGLYWWRRYLQNKKMIAHLRRQNRLLRRLLQAE